MHFNHLLCNFACFPSTHNGAIYQSNSRTIFAFLLWILLKQLLHSFWRKNQVTFFSSIGIIILCMNAFITPPQYFCVFLSFFLLFQMFASSLSFFLLNFFVFFFILQSNVFVLLTFLWKRTLIQVFYQVFFGFLYSLCKLLVGYRLKIGSCCLLFTLFCHLCLKNRGKKM